jgi:dienelactone hydrolase
MRFYLNAPLVIGYISMATTACLGMLQLAAARGDYAGLALFTADRKRGAHIGLGLTGGALLAYVTFAPEILTPGPAGTEVAIMFALCALLALAVTLAGADRRLRRKWGHLRRLPGGEAVQLGNLSATLYRPAVGEASLYPAVAVLPDPTAFVRATSDLVGALNQAGIAVLWLDAQAVTRCADPLSRQTLLGHLSTAVVYLTHQLEIIADRIGLLGLGLAGDAVWQAARADPQIRAALAVSPMALTASPPQSPPQAGEKKGGAPPGLAWLHELSYRQVWRWRRRRDAFQRAAADLQMPGAALSTPSERLAALYGVDAILTMRTTNAENSLFPIASRRHFTLLEEGQAMEQTVAWFRDRLMADD